MKTILYIFIVMSALFISKTESFSDVVKLAGTSFADTVLSLVTGRNTLEVRSVDADGFEKAISQKGRVVVVLFWDEFSPESKSNSRKLEKAMAVLPKGAMLCKVAANKNASLAKELSVAELPTVMIYYEGDLMREYNSDVDPEHLVATVRNYLDTSLYGSGRGSIEALDENWIPDGVHKLESNKGNYTPL